MNNKAALSINVIFFISLFFALISCKKDTVPKPTPAQQVDVYATGYLLNPDNRTTAAYWKNGTVVKLGSDTVNTRGISITVKGNNVYVMGITVPNSLYGALLPTFWKNGTETQIAADGTFPFTGYDMAVNGDDVYVNGYITDIDNSGYPLHKPAYWKNGAFTLLPYNPAIYGDYRNGGIVVNGNDVYVGGTLTHGTNLADSTVGVYWKNGTINYLTNGNASTWVNNIKLIGTDVYAMGYSFNLNTATFKGTYWKNSVGHEVSNALYETELDDIAINGNDTYLFGSSFFNTRTVATYWKNGIGTQLTSNDYIYDYIYKQFVLNGNDLYAAVFPASPTSPFYWKNGSIVSWTGDSLGTIVNIAIVPR